MCAKLGCQQRPLHAHLRERSWAQKCRQLYNETGRQTWPTWTKTKQASALFAKLPNLQISQAYVRRYHGSYGRAGEGGRYSVFLLSLTTALQLYHTEGLHPPRHPVTAAVLRTAIKDTPSNRHFTSCVPYFLCANRYSFSLFAMTLRSASWVISSSHITTIPFFLHFHFVTELSFFFAI